jgi:hypothetical protein
MFYPVTVAEYLLSMRAMVPLIGFIMAGAFNLKKLSSE